MKVVYFPLPSALVCALACSLEKWDFLGWSVTLLVALEHTGPFHQEATRKWKAQTEVVVFFKLAFTGKKEDYMEKGLK